MQGFSILKTVFDSILSTGLAKEVFHSVEILATSKGRFPAYPKGSQMLYVGVDDTKIMNVYVRQIEDLKVLKVVPVSSNLSNYQVSIAHRVVFFNDHEGRNQDDLLKTLMQFVFLPGVKLLKMIVDKEKLLQLESKPSAFSLTEKSFYCAIDFDINFSLTKNNCEIEIACETICNPYTLNN